MVWFEPLHPNIRATEDKKMSLKAISQPGHNFKHVKCPNNWGIEAAERIQNIPFICLFTLNVLEESHFGKTTF